MEEVFVALVTKMLSLRLAVDERDIRWGVPRKDAALLSAQRISKFKRERDLAFRLMTDAIRGMASAENFHSILSFSI